METEEQKILEYLKKRPGQFLTIKEISRFVESSLMQSKGPLWAAPFLNNLLEAGQIEANSKNHYRYEPGGSKQRKISVSPHIAAILKASGKNFSESVDLDGQGETKAT